MSTTPFKDVSNASRVPGKTPLKASEKKMFNERVRLAKQLENDAKETRGVGLMQAARLHLHGALQEYRAALEIYPGHDRLSRKVSRLETELSEDVQPETLNVVASPPPEKQRVRRPPRVSSPTTPFKSNLRLFEHDGEGSDRVGGVRSRVRDDSSGDDEEEDEKQTRAMVAAVESGWEFNEAQNAAVLPGGYALPSNFFEKLFPHQRTGVAWAWGLYSESHGSDSLGGAGGILGDDMGLGAPAVDSLPSADDRSRGGTRRETLT